MGLKIKNLTKAFDKKTLFRDFSYDFDDTGIYALTGASGVGKTTLLRIIAGLDTDFEGEVLGAGIKNVSICFQENRLFPHLSAFDNILKISFKEENEVNKKAVKQLLTRLKFTESDMELRPAELSGGMRQRIAFARAVLRDSSILILDEATKELDSALVETILEIIREQGNGRLVLIVTHKSSEIEALGAKNVFLSEQV